MSALENQLPNNPFLDSLSHFRLVIDCGRVPEICVLDKIRLFTYDKLPILSWSAKAISLSEIHSCSSIEINSV